MEKPSFTLAAGLWLPLAHAAACGHGPSLPGVGGLEVTRRLRARPPETGGLIFSVHEEAVFVQRARGRCPWVPVQSCAAEEMLAALADVAADRRYVHPMLAEHKAG